MCAKKLLFFDIDGTLWDFHNNIPKSAVDAIRAASANGHKVFINSGRTKAFIQDKNLLDIGFDGIVSGCGTMIEYNNETVFYEKLDPQYISRVIKILRKHRFKPLLEGREYLYIDREEFGGDLYAQKLSNELGDRLQSIDDHAGKWEASKISCATEPNEHQGAIAELGEEFDFMIHSPTVVEMISKGFSKGNGIKKVCELLDHDISDTIAFGDSANDLPMLEAAGFSVVMGNGSEQAKEAADLITSDLDDDGIARAIRELELI